MSKGKLDAFVKEKIKNILKAEPLYFMRTLHVKDLLHFMDCVYEPQKEKLQCIEKNEGDSRAMSAFIDEIQRYSGFALEFLRGLDQTGHKDMAERLISGFDARYLPDCEDMNFIRHLLGSPPPYSDSPVLNEIMGEQHRKIAELSGTQTNSLPNTSYSSEVTTMSYGGESGGSGGIYSDASEERMNIEPSAISRDDNFSTDDPVTNSHLPREAAPPPEDGRGTSNSTGANGDINPSQSNTIREPTDRYEINTGNKFQHRNPPPSGRYCFQIPETMDRQLSDIHESSIRISNPETGFSNLGSATRPKELLISERHNAIDLADNSVSGGKSNRQPEMEVGGNCVSGTSEEEVTITHESAPSNAASGFAIETTGHQESSALVDVEKGRTVPFAECAATDTLKTEESTVKFNDTEGIQKYSAPISSNLVPFEKSDVLTVQQNSVNRPTLAENDTSPASDTDTKWNVFVISLAVMSLTTLFRH